MCLDLNAQSPLKLGWRLRVKLTHTRRSETTVTLGTSLPSLTRQPPGSRRTPTGGRIRLLRLTRTGGCRTKALHSRELIPSGSYVEFAKQAATNVRKSFSEGFRYGFLSASRQRQASF